MYEKAEKVVRLIAFVIVIGLLIFTASHLYPSEDFYKSMLKDREAKSYSGVVAEKYVDSAEHAAPMLKLTSTNAISLERNFWDQVEVGDSIVKIKDQAYITLYKDNKIKEVFDYNVYFDELIQRSKK